MSEVRGFFWPLVVYTKELTNWIKIRPHKSPTMQFNTTQFTQHLTTFPALGSESQHFSAFWEQTSLESYLYHVHLCSCVAMKNGYAVTCIRQSALGNSQATA